MAARGRTEGATAALRARYMPLFRQQRVSLMFTGHEHLFEHWIERFERDGRRGRLDEIVTGGGGAPLYALQGRPDLREYLAAGAADKVAVQQLVRPGPERGDNPYHYVVVQVDGERVKVEVIGIDWGSDFTPYRSRGTELGGHHAPRAPSAAAAAAAGVGGCSSAALICWVGLETRGAHGPAALRRGKSSARPTRERSLTGAVPESAPSPGRGAERRGREGLAGADSRRAPRVCATSQRRARAQGAQRP
jgi:hypothetical protein